MGRPSNDSPGRRARGNTAAAFGGACAAMLGFGPCLGGPTVRLEDGLVVFLAIATGGVLLAGLAQALESRRRPPRPRARPRPGAHPGGAASPLPVPPTE